MGRHTVSATGPLTGRRTGIIVAFVITVLGAVAGVAAYAFWSSSGHGSASASTGTLTAPGKPSATGTSTITLNWSASSVSGGGTVHYTVERKTGSGGTYAAIVCADSTATTCQDSPSAGNYFYRVTATYHSWTAQSPESDQVTVNPAPDAPTSVALVNGGGSSNAYVNSANQHSVNIDVTLPSTSVTTDTVHVKASDGTSPDVVAPTKPGVTGGGVLHFTGLDVSSLNDGTLTFTAWSSNGGGSSANATATNTKDTVAPATPASVALTNGGGTGNAFINGTNKASLNYNVVLGASGNSSTDTVKVTLTSGASVTGTTSGSNTNGATRSVTGINATTLTDGSVIASANVTDQAGNASGNATNGPTGNTKDTVAPATPASVSLTNGGGTGNAFINGTNKASLNYNVVLGASGNSSTDTVTVTLTSGASVTGTTSGSNTNGATRSVTGINATTLTDGSVIASANVTDQAGNASGNATNGPTGNTKDTVAPATPTSVALTNGGGTGNAFINSTNKSALSYGVLQPASAADSTSDTVTVTLSSTGGGSSVSGTAAGADSTGATTSVSGINATGLGDGSVTAIANVTDVAGNTSGTVSTSNSKDTVAPATPASVSLTNGGGTGNAFINGTNKGSLSYYVVLGASGNTSSDTVTVTLTSSGSVSGTTTGSNTNGATRSVTGIDATTLSDGTVIATAKVTDQAGNASGNATNGPTGNTKDTVAPNAPTGVALASGQDTGASSSDGITKINNPTFTGSAENNSTITLLNNATSTQVGSGSTNSTGTLTAQISPSLTDASYTIVARATDTAGNTSAASSGAAITIDTVGPTISSITSADAGGTPGLAQNGDSVSILFNEAVADSAAAGETMTVCAKNDCNPNLAAGNSKIIIPGFTSSGGFTVGTNYENDNAHGTATGTISRSADKLTLTYTLTSALSGTPATGTSQTFTFNLDTSAITDLAGNAAPANSSVTLRLF